MEKTFEIIKKHDLLTGEESAVYYVCETDENSRQRVLDRLNASLKGKEKELCHFSYDEKMPMHLLPDLSQATIRELSSRMYCTAYALCHRRGKKEKVLYLSLFKDTALRYKTSLPEAVLKLKGKEYPHPDYYVKELRLSL